MFFRRLFTHILCWLLIFPLLGGCGLVQMLQEQPPQDDTPQDTSWAADPVPYDVRIVVEKPLPRPEGDAQRLRDEAAAVKKEVAAARSDADPYARPLDEEKEESPRKPAPSAVDPDAAHENAASTPRRDEFDAAADALKEKMEAASTLLQLRKEAPDSLLALERRARLDKESAEQLLHAQGYYEGTADFHIDTSGKKAQVVLRLVPGPRYVLGRAIVRYEPEPFVPEAFRNGTRRAQYSGLQGLLGREAREPVSPPRFPRHLRLEPGKPVTAEEMLEAVDRVGRYLRRQGYPIAKTADSRYTLDRESRTINAEIVIDPGPPALMGEVRLVSASEVAEAYLRRLAYWRPDDERWNSRRVGNYGDRLRGLGLFNSVTLKPALDEWRRQSGPGKVAPLPLDLSVEDAPFRSLGAEARYDTDTGFGVEAEWEHRNILGNGESLRLNLPVTTEKQGLVARFEKPAFLRSGQSLDAQASALHEDTDAYERRGLAGYAYLNRRVNRYWRVGVGAGGDGGQIAEDGQGMRLYSVIGPRFTVRRDSRDNKVSPRDGTLGKILVSPVAGYYDKTFTALTGEAEWMGYYAPFHTRRGKPDDRLVLAARLAAGMMAGVPLHAMPASMRYYAGGAGSVRGYSYQSLGPRNSKGDPLGGRSYQLVNLEARFKITDDVGLVPFLDGGMAYREQYPTLDDMHWGTGIGLRYYTPVGPLRLDVATPLNPVDGDPPVQFYISIGQSF